MPAYDASSAGTAVCKGQLSSTGHAHLAVSDRVGRLRLRLIDRSRKINKNEDEGD